MFMHFECDSARPTRTWRNWRRPDLLLLLRPDDRAPGPGRETVRNRRIHVGRRIGDRELSHDTPFGAGFFKVALR
jgi:hypothetical protein